MECFAPPSWIVPSWIVPSWIVPPWIVLTVACFAAIVAARPAGSWAQGPPRAAPVEVAVVRRAKLAAGKTFLGTVMPRRRSDVGSAVNGRVAELLVDDGDYVTQDSPMVQLRTGTIEIAVAAAKAELELRTQEFNEMDAGSRPEEKDRARAQLARAEALRDYRDATFRRTEQLYAKSRTASQEEFEEARQTKAVAEQSYQEMKSNLELVMAGPRKEQKAQAQARMAIAAEEVRRLEDRLKKYTIRAPFDGYVVTKYAEVGQWLKEGDLVLGVMQLDPVEVDFALPESYIASIRRGMSARIRVDALKDRLFIGEVSRIVPQADLRSRAFPIKIRLKNPRDEHGHLLKAGMLAQVTISVGVLKGDALQVPKDALVLGGPSPLVYVLQPAGKGKPPLAQPIPVQLGGAAGSWIEVSGKLSAGQQVVTRGNERLRPGQPVNVLKNPNPPADR